MKFTFSMCANQLQLIRASQRAIADVHMTNGIPEFGTEAEKVLD